MDMTQVAVETDVWVPIALAPEYEINMQGAVRSVRTKKLKTVMETKHGTLYVQVGVLRKTVSANGRKWGSQFLNLADEVARAYLGPMPRGQRLYHRDGNRHNVMAANLFYSETDGEGIRSKLYKGASRPKGTRLVYIPSETLIAIRNRIALEQPTQREIRAMGEDYGLSQYIMMKYFFTGWKGAFSENQLAA